MTKHKRGIKFHEEWVNDFELFLKEVSRKPGPGFDLDRIDNDKGYVPGNIRWATRKQNNSNRKRACTNCGYKHC